MKKIGMVLVVIVALIVVLLLSKNAIAKTAVSAGVKAMTGLRLNIKSMNIGTFKALIGIKGSQPYNPEGFKDYLMVDMPEIFVNYDSGAFLKRKVHLGEVRINLQEFVLLKTRKVSLESRCCLAG